MRYILYTLKTLSIALCEFLNLDCVSERGTLRLLCDESRRYMQWRYRVLALSVEPLSCPEATTSRTGCNNLQQRIPLSRTSLLHKHDTHILVQQASSRQPHILPHELQTACIQCALTLTPRAPLFTQSYSRENELQQKKIYKRMVANCGEFRRIKNYT